MDEKSAKESITRASLWRPCKLGQLYDSSTDTLSKDACLTINNTEMIFFPKKKIDVSYNVGRGVTDYTSVFKIPPDQTLSELLELQDPCPFYDIFRNPKGDFNDLVGMLVIYVSESKMFLRNSSCQSVFVPGKIESDYFVKDIMFGKLLVIKFHLPKSKKGNMDVFLKSLKKAIDTDPTMNSIKNILKLKETSELLNICQMETFFDGQNVVSRDSVGNGNALISTLRSIVNGKTSHPIFMGLMPVKGITQTIYVPIPFNRVDEKFLHTVEKMMNNFSLIENQLNSVDKLITDSTMGFANSFTTFVIEIRRNIVAQNKAAMDKLRKNILNYRGHGDSLRLRESAEICEKEIENITHRLSLLDKINKIVSMKLSWYNRFKTITNLRLTTCKTVNVSKFLNQKEVIVLFFYLSASLNTSDFADNCKYLMGLQDIRRTSVFFYVLECCGQCDIHSNFMSETQQVHVYHMKNGKTLTEITRGRSTSAPFSKKLIGKLEDCLRNRCPVTITGSTKTESTIEALGEERNTQTSHCNEVLKSAKALRTNSSFCSVPPSSDLIPERGNLPTFKGTTKTMPTISNQSHQTQLNVRQMLGKPFAVINIDDNPSQIQNLDLKTIDNIVPSISNTFFDEKTVNTNTANYNPPNFTISNDESLDHTHSRIKREEIYRKMLDLFSEFQTDGITELKKMECENGALLASQKCHFAANVEYTDQRTQPFSQFENHPKHVIVEIGEGDRELEHIVNRIKYLQISGEGSDNSTENSQPNDEIPLEIKKNTTRNQPTDQNTSESVESYQSNNMKTKSEKNAIEETLDNLQSTHNCRSNRSKIETVADRLNRNSKKSEHIAATSETEVTCQPRNTIDNEGQTQIVNGNYSSLANTIRISQTKNEPIRMISSENMTRSNELHMDDNNEHASSETDRASRVTANKTTNDASPHEEINILILGETGVGKSTFVNAFANYLTSETLEDATNADLVSLIHTSFTLMDDNYESKVIEFGEKEENEVDVVGASKTRYCKSYVFQSEGRLIRLIDTPGVGDTSGIEKDNQNFINILKFITNYPEIHGILLLLKPNDSRLSTFFRFCIQELLKHLSSSASHNIVFVFTNAKSTFYVPGDTLPVLTDMLDSLESVKIKLSRDNVYCLDNEAFRYLIASARGVEFHCREIRDFSKSWDVSVSECKRLLKHVKLLKPHAVKESLSLNGAIDLIRKIRQPLCELLKCMCEYISEIEQRHEQVTRWDELISTEIVQNFEIPDLHLNCLPEGHMVSICESPSCSRIGDVGYNYPNICHNKCDFTKPNENFDKMCQIMTATNGCPHCNCPWSTHMHTNYIVGYKIFGSSVTRIGSGVFLQLNKESKVKFILSQLFERLYEVTENKMFIISTLAKMQLFIKTHSILNNQDEMEQWLRRVSSLYFFCIKYKNYLRRGVIESHHHLTQLIESYVEQLRECEREKREIDINELSVTTSSLLEIPKFGLFLKDVLFLQRGNNSETNLANEKFYCHKKFKF